MQRSITPRVMRRQSRKIRTVLWYLTDNMGYLYYIILVDCGASHAARGERPVHSMVSFSSQEGNLNTSTMRRQSAGSEHGVTTIESSSRNYKKKFFGWLSLISVEPTMWLFMMAYMMTSVVEQALFVHKSCRVNHGFSEEYCKNVSQNATLKNQVQLTVSNFHQWDGIAAHAVPIILALWFGNWSDRRGRKLPLLIGLCGKFIYSGMIIVNSVMVDWDLYMIIYTASLPMGMFGGDVAIFASCFAYISDVSSVRQRTLRVTILDVVYLSTMPTGVALGSYLFTEVFNYSYTIMFAINTSLLVVAIIYTIFALEWQTSPQQKPLAGVNVVTDFFDKKHVRATIETVTKSRPHRGRLHLWLLFLAMAFYTFQRDEKRMSYLYTQLIFNWDVSIFSKFKTFQSSLFVVAMLVGVPLMSKIIGMKDTSIVIIGALSHAIGRMFFAMATGPELFYVGAGIAALGPSVAPALRSLTSKVVPVDERGKVFAILSVCDNAVPFFSGVLYSQLYNTTYRTSPSSIYWLTFSTQIAVMVLIMFMHFSTRSDHRGDRQDFESCESSTAHIQPVPLTKVPCNDFSTNTSDTRL